MRILCLSCETTAHLMCLDLNVFRYKLLNTFVNMFRSKHVMYAFTSKSDCNKRPASYVSVEDYI